MIKPGEEWGSAATDPPDLEVRGGDTDLAAAVAGAPGALIRFIPAPSSDLALSVGLEDGRATTTEVPMDALRVGDELAVNMVVLGTPPDRLTRFSRMRWFTIEIDDRSWFAGPATSVLIATGEFLRGNDLVPRGHPGDGRAEAQVYALNAGERRLVGERLRNGTHVPNPRVLQRIVRRFAVTVERQVRLEVDGVARGRVETLAVEVVPAAYRLLI
jgi:diacylglycerol kinase family enzyme